MGNKNFERIARELVGQMTLEEKVFQTLYHAPAIERLGVKAYNWWNEALHGVARAGVATVFPQAIGLAATFDGDLVERVADAISTEGRGKFNMQQKYGDSDIYKGLTFWSPNINIFRDPRWGRGHETYGEDPYLTSRIALRFIRGIQGTDGTYLKAAACAKHFAVHSGPEDLRHSFDAVVSKQDLYETYLPAFKACVQEGGVESVMGAYNSVNGEPCCGSKMLLVDFLRGQWGFRGHVVSDCWAIRDFHEHHKVTSGPLESVALAMNNGCDLNCGNMYGHLLPAVQQGLVEEATLDTAVTRLFAARLKLGALLDEPDPTPWSGIGYDQVDTPENAELNFEAARKCAVLLKNEGGLLPLDKSKFKTVGIIGPNANNRRALVGNYEGTASRYFTITEGIQEYLGGGVRVLYSDGCHLYRKKVENLAQPNDRLSEVRGVCEQSDIIIACMGLDPGLEGEEGDRGNQYASGDKPALDLPGLQESVLQAIHGSGKPVILVLLSGSALAVNWADEHIPAIIQGWYPGAQGGRAIASLIFGDYSPEGKLPVTFYRSLEELPEFTDYTMTGSCRTYRYMKSEPLYPFGYGLSYTRFELSGASISCGADLPEGDVTLEADVKNTGSMAAAQTVQVYVKCMREGSPNHQLKALTKISLAPGESRRVKLTVPAKAFGLYDEDARLMIYEGGYRVFIGFSQPDARSVALMGQAPHCFELRAGADREII